MKFFVFGDTTANLDLFRRIGQIGLPKYEFGVFTGDLAGMKEMQKVGQTRDVTGALSGAVTQGDYDQIHNEIFADPLEKFQAVVRAVGKISSKINIYGVLGNADLQAFVQTTKLHEYIKMIHNRVVEVEGYYLVGYGGRSIHLDEVQFPDKPDFMGFPFRYGAELCHAYTQVQIFDALSPILERLEMRKTILVTHEPPYGILDQVAPEVLLWATKSFGDSAKEGHIGSQALRRLVDKYEPLMHLFGHVHEGKGVLRDRMTIFVNVGSSGDDEDLVEVDLRDGVDVGFVKLPTRVQ